jgi:hypothetical protein
MPLGKSPILLNDLMAEGDNNKHLLFNNALIKLEDALNRALSVNLAAGNVTLTETQITSFGVFTCSGHSVLRTLTIPTVLGVALSPTNRIFAVRNTGTSAVTVTHGGAGEIVTVPADETALLYANGTDVLSLGGVSNNATIAVANEGVSVAATLSALNFTGNGVTASLDGTTVVVDVDNTDTFLGLTDAPDAYTGQGGKLVAVKGDVSGLEFVTPPVTGVLVEDEGITVIAPALTLNFAGAGVTTTDAGSGEVLVTIPGNALTVQDEGTTLTTTATKFNFVGAGVTVSEPTPDEVTITIPTGGGGGSALTVEDEGTPLTTAATKLNFVGANVTATEGSPDEVTVTITGGSGGSALTVEDEGTPLTTAATKLNFVGAGVTVTEPTPDEVTITIAGGAGSSTFTALTDAPSSYVGQAGRVPRVAMGETSLVFDDYLGPGTITVPFAAFAGARCHPTADQNYTTLNAWDTIRFSAADRNPGGLYWSAGAPNRLTVPTGVTKVRLSFSGRVDTSDAIPATNQFTIWKNGSATLLLGTSTENLDVDGYTTNTVTTQTDVLDVVPGDYFEAKYFSNATFTLDATANQTWFAMEVLEQTSVSAYLGDVLDVLLTAPTNGQGLVYNTSLGKWVNANPNAILPSGSGIYREFMGAMVRFNSDPVWSTFPRNPVAWDAADYDVGGFWSAGSPQRFTIPTGVLRVRLHCNLKFVPGTFLTNTAYFIQFMKNGSLSFRGNSLLTATNGYVDVGVTITSPVLSVVAGDFFEVYFTTTEGSTSPEASNSQFSIEVVESVAP